MAREVLNEKKEYSKENKQKSVKQREIKPGDETNFLVGVVRSTKTRGMFTIVNAQPMCLAATVGRTAPDRPPHSTVWVASLLIPNVTVLNERSIATLTQEGARYKNRSLVLLKRRAKWLKKEVQYTQIEGTSC